jgi:hypothetical protein
VDDEIDISPIFPYIFEIEIKNLQLLTNLLADFSGQVDAPWNEGPPVGVGFKYSFTRIGPPPELRSDILIRHDVRAIAIELVIANRDLPCRRHPCERIVAGLTQGRQISFTSTLLCLYPGRIICRRCLISQRKSIRPVSVAVARQCSILYDFTTGALRRPPDAGRAFRK